MAWSEPMRILALLAVLALPACSPGAPEGPNLLLVSLDTTRFDHTSLGDYERDTTPRLRALAAEGASFDLAYAPTATTGPTHATLFTSRLPRDHGVVKNGVELDVRLHTLAEHLASHGWRTPRGSVCRPINPRARPGSTLKPLCLWASRWYWSRWRAYWCRPD